MRYAALLRGVSPMNLKMPDLKRALESAGFENVKTVLSSGNVLFDGPAKPDAAIEKLVESALEAHVARVFPTIVRRVEVLKALIEEDPFASLKVGKGAKRVVTFLKRPATTTPKLPVRLDNATLHALRGVEAFTSYVPEPGNPIFMTLIEKTLGKDVTTRTWDTVLKLAR